jgi:hypothetical protein
MRDGVPEDLGFRPTGGNSMSVDAAIYEPEQDEFKADPDETPIRGRRLFTQPYDLAVEALVSQIRGRTIFLRPLSDRPHFQRKYVWKDDLASRLIESILLNVPIPPCYLSQNEDFEYDVIDGQQRLYSMYRFLENQFALTDLRVLTELNGKRFFELPEKTRRQVETHTVRCVLITRDSDPDIKFEVFERLNSNTVPLNAQELRNCEFRGALNDLLGEVVEYPPWLEILGRKAPDIRMRDEELALRFFAFHTRGVGSYRTPQKHWLNSAAKQGMRYSSEKIAELRGAWQDAIGTSLRWFGPAECFRRGGGGRRVLNRALFDLVMLSAVRLTPEEADKVRDGVRSEYTKLLADEEFTDLISRAVDHASRTARRFELWDETVGQRLGFNLKA